MKLREDCRGNHYNLTCNFCCVNFLWGKLVASHLNGIWKNISRLVWMRKCFFKRSSSNLKPLGDKSFKLEYQQRIRKKNKEKKNIICFYPKPSSTLSFHLDLSKIHILSLSPKVYHKTSTARLLDWLLEVNFCPSKTNQRHKNRY